MNARPASRFEVIVAVRIRAEKLRATPRAGPPKVIHSRILGIAKLVADDRLAGLGVFPFGFLAVRPN
jgi:hypothetical protein